MGERRPWAAPAGHPQKRAGGLCEGLTVRILRQVKEPVIIHWMGGNGRPPALDGHWGSGGSWRAGRLEALQSHKHFSAQWDAKIDRRENFGAVRRDKEIEIGAAKLARGRGMYTGRIDFKLRETNRRRRGRVMRTQAG